MFHFLISFTHPPSQSTNTPLRSCPFLPRLPLVLLFPFLHSSGPDLTKKITHHIRSLLIPQYPPMPRQPHHILPFLHIPQLPPLLQNLHQRSKGRVSVPIKLGLDLQRLADYREADDWRMCHQGIREGWENNNRRNWNGCDW